MLVVAGLVVALGALVQGAVGYGMALVAAPLLALLDPALVPVPLIVLSAGHSVLAVLRDGRHADWAGVGWAMLGRLPGTGLGVLAVVALSHQVFSLVVGSCVLAFVLLSLLTWRPRRAALVSAAELAPFLLAGFVLSGPARHVLDQGWTRHAVLTVAAASAGLLVGRSLL
ncbi:MAG: TSUP family transporter [Actinobacteria bacterium]|nr:TSUP family transporter [Actinomycetota bacterium]